MIFVDGIIIIQLFNMINKDITILSSPKVLRWHQLGQHIGEIEAWTINYRTSLRFLFLNRIFNYLKTAEPLREDSKVYTSVEDISRGWLKEYL